MVELVSGESVINGIPRLGLLNIYTIYRCHFFLQTLGHCVNCTRYIWLSLEINIFSSILTFFPSKSGSIVIPPLPQGGVAGSVRPGRLCRTGPSIRHTGCCGLTPVSRSFRGNIDIGNINIDIDIETLVWEY